MAHHKNSMFQTLSFIVGQAATPDGAVDVLIQQMEERDTAVGNANADKIKHDGEVKVARLVLTRAAARNERALRAIEKFKADRPEIPEEAWADPNELLGHLDDAAMEAYWALEDAALRVETEAREAAHKLEQSKAFYEQSLRCYNKAIEEREFLVEFLNQLIPHTVLKEEWLSNPDSASEKIQRSEWLAKFTNRIENEVASNGMVSAAQLEAMRSHADWALLDQYVLRCVAVRNEDPVGFSRLISQPTGLTLLLMQIGDRISGGKAVGKGYAPSATLPAFLQFDQRAFANSAAAAFAPTEEDHVPLLRRSEKVKALPLNMTPEQVATEFNTYERTYKTGAALSDGGRGPQFLLAGASEETDVAAQH